MRMFTSMRVIRIFKKYTMHKYAKVSKSVVKKMKKIVEEHKSTLVQLKDAKCEVEELKEELLNAYSKIKFLELEVIQANVKVECITTKKLDSMLSSQKPSTDKTIWATPVKEAQVANLKRR